MANMTFKANLLPNSDLEYSLGSADKRWKIYAETQPQQTKTFTGVIGTANDVDNATFYFGSVRPTGAFTDQWSITYRVNAIAAGDSRAKAFSILTINGHADTYSSYAAWNAIYNTSYRPCYYHVYYRLKEAGFNNNYGHALGLRLYSGWNAAVAANARTITIDILDTYNCTFEFYGDTMLKYSAIPGTGSTNYSAKSEFDFCNNGLKETGDDNTTEDGSIYISAKTGAKGIWQTGLVMEDGNGTYQNICLDSSGGVTRTTATTKIPNPNGFRVGGTIWFSNGNYAANTNITGWLNMYNESSAFDSRYTLNTTLTEELILEGLARECVSKVQQLRKNNDFNIVDRINLYYSGDEDFNKCVSKFENYIKLHFSVCLWTFKQIHTSKGYLFPNLFSV